MGCGSANGVCVLQAVSRDVRGDATTRSVAFCLALRPAERAEHARHVAFVRELDLAQRRLARDVVAVHLLLRLDRGARPARRDAPTLHGR
jgi:hypothetical protein